MSTAAASSGTTGTVTQYTPPTNTNAYGKATAGGATLKQADFLNLLTEQLKNQDPTNPTSNTDFAAQMAQFSSLSEMDSLNGNMTSFIGLNQLSSGSSLIGKTVTTSLLDSTGKPLTGVVQSVSVQSNKLMLDVNGQSVNYSTVTGVQPAPASA